MNPALAVLLPLAAAGHPALRRRLSAPALGWLLSLAPAGALITVAAHHNDLAGGAALRLRFEWLRPLETPAAFGWVGAIALARDAADQQVF